MVFLCSSCGTQLFILSRIFEGVSEFAQPAYVCCVDLEKAFDCVLQSILCEMLQEYGVSGPLSWLILYLYNHYKSLVCIADHKS